MPITVTRDGESQEYDALSYRYDGLTASEQVLVIVTAADGELRFPLADYWVDIGD